MVSRTKYEVDEATAAKLFCAAGLEGASGIAPLGAGEYNAVYSAKAGGGEYVLKIAPAGDVPVLTHEKGMMEAEVFWYDQMRRHTSIRVPEVFYSDFSHALLPTGYFIMEKLPGAQLDKMDLSPEEKAQSAAQLARMAAQLHGIGNDRFGYVQAGLHDTWYGAIRAMVQAVLDDAARAGKRTKRGRRLLAAIDTHAAVLEKAPCAMVNFDIWPPNILCTREVGGIEYAWIDPERSFWGDPVIDFVCLEFGKPLARKTASLAAYNAVAAAPVQAGREETLRYAVGLGYLGLIMEVEKYYRYTPRHFGWWRNVLASAMLFAEAFKALERG